MKHIDRSILIVILAMISTAAFGQGLYSGYFINDYKYRHDLNPAFGNSQNYISFPGMGNINITTYGNFGLDDILFDNPEYPVNSDKKKTTFMNPYIENALGGFNKGDNILGANVSLSLMSAGFKAFGGYNTIEVNSKTNVYGKLPYGLFEFAKNTGNKEYNIGDISINARSLVEVAVGHSHQINDRLRVGGKLKLLLGAANVSLKMENVTADLSDDTWTIKADNKADVSMKGFSYKSETKEYKSRTGSYEYVNSADMDNPGIGGIGFGIDFGAEYKIGEDFTISAAVLDLGFINWTNDVQAENRQKTFTFNGFHDLSVQSDNGGSIDDQSDEYSDQLANFANLQDKGDQGSKQTTLGATVNIGGSYTLPCYRKLSFGVLSSNRFESDYSFNEGRLSVNIAPLSWLDGGVNYVLNTYYSSMGWIINIHPKGLNLFIGMDNIVNSFSKNYVPLDPNINVAVGINVAW
ncbi:MAG: DUF5723 family protein [Bacteroidales bacterium]|jgi:hypothetical protein|nr:DUF5723 family protein [Bacteroidales bacterium]MCI1785226.1 DUF5723 family protein [Bacteroidales bacterium]